MANTFDLTKNDLSNLKILLFQEGTGGDFLTNLYFLSYVNEEIFLDYTKQFNHSLKSVIDKIYDYDSKRWGSKDSTGRLLFDNKLRINEILNHGITNGSVEKLIYKIISNIDKKYISDSKPIQINIENFLNSLNDIKKVTSHTPWLIRSHPSPIIKYYDKNIDPFPKVKVYYPYFSFLLFIFRS